MTAAAWLKIKVILASVMNILFLQQYFIESTISVKVTQSEQAKFKVAHHDYLLHRVNKETLADGKPWQEYVPELTSTAELNCTFQILKDALSPVLWYRRNMTDTLIECDPNNKKYECVEGKDVRVAEDNENITLRNYTLFIKDVSLTDLGEYLCSINSTPIVNCLVSFRSRPIINLQRISSINSIQKIEPTSSEGENVILQCSVKWIFPKEIKSIEWSWRPASSTNFSKINSDLDGEVHTYLENGTSYLVLNRVRREHRAVYQCTIHNEFSVAYAALYLRVRYPKATLWPFIGICLELLLLAIIIISSEILKRRKHIANDEREESKSSQVKPCDIYEVNASEDKTPEEEQQKQQEEIISILLQQSNKQLPYQQSVHVDDDVFQHEDKLAPIAIPEDGSV